MSASGFCRQIISLHSENLQGSRQLPEAFPGLPFWARSSFPNAGNFMSYNPYHTLA